MSEIKLKPCPFCGGEATAYSTANGYYRVGCNNTHCDVYPYTDPSDTYMDAVEAWNRRAES